MVRHIVSWQVNEDVTQEEKVAKLAEIKSDLEGLKTVIPGVVELVFKTELLPVSTAELMLNSLFESQEALDSYQVHPAHQAVVAKLKAITCKRHCIDYVE